jgi:hypothetical protein
MRCFGRRYLGVLLVCSLVASLSGCGGDDGGSDGLPAGVVARVGDKVIREQAVAAQLRRAYEARGGTPKSFGPPDYLACAKLKRNLNPGYTLKDIHRQCKYEYQNTRAAALSTLVRSEHLKREARRRGIDANGEIAKALARAYDYARRRLTGAQLRVLLSTRSIQRPDVESKSNVLRERLLAAMPLTESEIQGHAAANAEVFLESESRQAQILQIKTKPSALKARQQLDDHVAWIKVQDRYALEPIPGRWTGTLTIEKTSAPGDAFGRALFSAKSHEIIGPLRTLNGWFIFKVLKIRPARHQGLTHRARQHVASYMRLQKLEQVLYDHYAKITKCDPKYQTPSTPCYITPANSTNTTNENNNN